MNRVSEKYHSFAEAAERARELARSSKTTVDVSVGETGEFLVTWTQVQVQVKVEITPGEMDTPRVTNTALGIGRRVEELLLRYYSGAIGLELLQAALANSRPDSYSYQPLNWKELEALEEAVLNAGRRPWNR